MEDNANTQVVDVAEVAQADPAEAKALEQIKGMWSEDGEQPQDAAEAPEAAAPQPKPEKPPERLAELAKQDRRLREREAQVEARAKELESYAAAIEQLRKDPYEALRQIGVDPADVVSRFVAEASGEQPAAQEPPREIVELRGEVERLRAEQQRTVLSDVRSSELRSISELVARSEDRFPLVRESLSDGAAELVLQVAAEDFHKNRRAYEAGEPRPSYEDYAGWVESYLEDNAAKTLARLSKLPKFKDRFAPARGEDRREKATLTSKMSGEPARRRTSEYDEEEALREAEAMLKQSGWVEDNG